MAAERACSSAGLGSSSSTSADNKSPQAPPPTPLKTDPKPGRGLGPVYCIVASLNPRVRLLRTKQRLFRPAGMSAAVAEPLGSPPPTHPSKISSKTRTIIGIQPRPALGFSCSGLGLWPPLSSSLPYLGLNRVRSLRRHLTIFYRRAGTDEHRRPPIPYRHSGSLNQLQSLLYKAAIFIGLGPISTRI